MSTTAIDSNESKPKSFDDFSEEGKKYITQFLTMNTTSDPGRKYNDYLVQQYAAHDNNILTRTKSLEELARHKNPGDVIIYTGYDYVRFSVMRNNKQNASGEGLEKYLHYTLNPRNYQETQYHIILSDTQQRPMFEMVCANLDHIKKVCELIAHYFNIEKSDIIYSKQPIIDDNLSVHDIIILSMFGTLPDNITKLTLFIDYVEQVNPELANKLFLKRTRIILDTDFKYTKLYLSNEMKYPYSKEEEEKHTKGNRKTKEDESSMPCLPPIEIIIFNGGGCLPPGNMAINITNNGVIGNNNNNNIINQSSTSTLISHEKEQIKRWICRNPPAYNEFSTNYYTRLKSSLGNQIKHMKLSDQALYSLINASGFMIHRYQGRNAWFK